MENLLTNKFGAALTMQQPHKNALVRNYYIRIPRLLQSIRAKVCLRPVTAAGKQLIPSIIPGCRWEYRGYPADA